MGRLQQKWQQKFDSVRRPSRDAFSSSVFIRRLSAILVHDLSCSFFVGLHWHIRCLLTHSNLFYVPFLVMVIGLLLSAVSTQRLEDGQSRWRLMALPPLSFQSPIQIEQQLRCTKASIFTTEYRPAFLILLGLHPSPFRSEFHLKISVVI